MKILYLTHRTEQPPAGIADYLSDLTFHGLRTLYGSDLVDIPKKEHMYNTYNNKCNLWGHGFTYACNLEDIEIDRSSGQHYDFIFLSVHWSKQFDYDSVIRLLNDLGYPNDRIAVLDGHDWPKYCEEYLNYTDFFFKRELEELKEKMYPIWFSLPENKIVDKVSSKSKYFANIVPGSTDYGWPEENRKTHIYKTEEEYYKDYQESYFGLTCKKGGWDCMRHYEILANGCVPIFTDLEDMPGYCCYMLPRSILHTAKRLNGLNLGRRGEPICYTGNNIILGKSYIYKALFNFNEYEDISKKLLEYTKTHLTTKYLAEYISGIIKL